MNTRSQVPLALLVFMIACDVCAADGPVPAASAPAARNAAVRQIEWDELLPKEERDNFNSQPPAPMHDYLGGGERGPGALQSGSFNVNLALNGAAVKLPGFVVPLDVSADGMVKEFFLVPYFGACIHVPPPPPNQIVYVRLAKGMKVDSLDDAQWVTGRLRTESKNSRYGAAAYTLEGDKVEQYKY